MIDFPDDESIRSALTRFFVAGDLPPDGGLSARWVKVRMGPFPVYFPNTAGRRRAVRLHDLHHIATGYQPTLIGEAEIGAWELASGCRNYLAAWILNAAAVAIGLFLSPRRVFRAFARGRRSRNLYPTGWSESLLEGTVGELREKLLPGEINRSINSH